MQKKKIEFPNKLKKINPNRLDRGHKAILLYELNRRYRKWVDLRL